MKKLLLFSAIAISLFGFNSIAHHTQGYIDSEDSFSGKVVKAYIANGYGRAQNEWLFMDLKTDSGRVLKVAIAPTFKIPNLPINEGDEVKVSGFTPLHFPNGVIKVVDIFDKTQNRDYPISLSNSRYWHTCQRGYNHNWHHHFGFCHH